MSVNACFVLAPIRPDLPNLPNEAQELVNILSEAGWRVHLMQEPATRLELWRMLDKGAFRLGWIGTHSSSDGFALTKEMLPPDLLGNLAKEAGCLDLVLNTCFSAEHVDVIQSKARLTNIVATIRPQGIDDQEAWSEALYLARRLVKTGSLRTAQQQAGPQYRWFPAPESPGVDDEEMAQQTDRQSDDRLRRTEENVERLTRAIQGEQFSGQPGLIAELREYIKRDTDWKRQTEDRIRLVEDGRAQGQAVTVSFRAVLWFIVSIAIVVGILIIGANLLAGRV